MKIKIISLSIGLLFISCFVTNTYSQNCTGTPDPGVAINTLVLCNYSTGFNLKTSQPLASGVTGQWEKSTNGTSWTNLLGATTNPYNYTGNLTSDMYYRFKATCTTSGLSAYSNVTKVTTVTGNFAFGVNEWNVYGFNSEYTHTQYKDINQTFNNYQGYYTQKLDASNDFGFNTILSWNEWYSPGKAIAFNNSNGIGSKWYGCSGFSVGDLMPDNSYKGHRKYTYISKRKGFPQGNYKIELTKWDDDLYIFINGIHVPYTG